MVDRVRHRSGHPDNADFAYALGPQFVDNVIVLFNEDHFDIPAVCIDRDVVLRQVVIDDAAQPVVGQCGFVQRHAHPRPRPRIWLRAVLGLITRPAATALTTRATLIVPRSSST